MLCALPLVFLHIVAASHAPPPHSTIKMKSASQLIPSVHDRATSKNSALAALSALIVAFALLLLLSWLLLRFTSSLPPFACTRGCIYMYDNIGLGFNRLGFLDRLSQEENRNGCRSNKRGRWCEQHLGS
jgi:apolipoprotein N-acyltransferase